MSGLTCGQAIVASMEDENGSAGRPRRRRLWYLLGGAAAALIAGFLVVYFVIFPTSSPKPFSITALTSSTSTSSSTAGSVTSSSAAASGSAGSSSAAGAPTGTWTIAAGSQAGYRVREKLAFLPAESDAVGRTSQIKGSATFAGAGSSDRITASSFTVNVYSLKSDREMRDEKIREIGLESSRYPTSTFSLSSPVDLPSGLLKGALVHVPVTGTLEIHGVSKTVTIPVELHLSASKLEAVGSITFPWAQFGMTAPSLGGFVNVTEHATMEFALLLTPAG